MNLWTIAEYHVKLWLIWKIFTTISWLLTCYIESMNKSRSSTTFNIVPLRCPKCPKLNYQIWITLYGLDGSLTWVCMYTQQCNVHTRKNQRWQIANLRLQGKVDHVIDRVRPQLYLWRCCVYWGEIISKVVFAVTTKNLYLDKIFQRSIWTIGLNAC